MEKCVFCQSDQIVITVKKYDILRYSCKKCGTKTDRHKLDELDEIVDKIKTHIRMMDK